MKKWICLFLCLGLIGGIIYYYNNKPSNKHYVYDFTLNFKYGNIYVKTSASELYPGHEIIAFSSKPVTNDMYAVYNGKTQQYDFCDDRKIVIYNQGCIFYKIRNDSLFIYSVLKGYGNLSVYSDKIKIVQIQSEIYEWKHYFENPEKYGLTKISAYK